MDLFLLYISKVSCILAIFYCTYYLFLKDETFFTFNRCFLLTGLLSALILPLFKIARYLEVEPLVYTTIDATTDLQTLPAIAKSQPTDYVGVLVLIYLIGVLIFSAKFVIQLRSLYKMINTNTVNKFGGFSYIECRRDIAPFSFFNYIFYNPDLYSKSELSLIVRHEIVHSSQWHSLDVLLSHLVTIVTWINPFSWLYRTGIKQNLEFLADEGAVREVYSFKNYQYTLLKVSGNQFFTPIVNTFYNSLIKKRIVMLNKSKSSKKTILKTALILPVLAIFLLAFNTKEIVVPITTDSKPIWMDDNISETIDLIIDKNTTDEELKEMKKDLAKKGIDFSYTTAHNEENEIISISIDFATKKDKGSKMKSSSSYNNDDGPIDPIHIIYDTASNSISIGNSGGIHVDVHEDADHKIWVHSDDEDEDGHKTIEIIEKNGKEVIKINGKKVSREDYKAMKEKGGPHEKHIKIKKSKSDGNSSVFVINSSDHDDEDIIEIEEGKGFFFIDTDGDENTQYIIDGKKSTKEKVKYLKPSNIETINVFKGDKAKEKYGKKGKGGVVEITTKKKKN